MVTTGMTAGRGAVCGALLMATTALTGVGAPVPAFAQATTGATRQFDIPAQSLQEAVLVFSRQSGLLVTAQGPLVEGRTSAAVSGRMASADALGRMLTGTGLTFRFNGNDAVSLEAVPQSSRGAIQLETVRVEGQGGPYAPSTSVLGTLPGAYAGGQIARGGQFGMLGNRDAMDAPFSQTSYTNKTIQDQQARTVQDVLKNDPSVVASTSSGTPHDYQVIRGFGGYSTDGTRTLNGVAGMAPLFFPSTDYIERVEVLKGPSGLLNGMSLSSAAVTGALGGSVNLVTKRATNEPITQVTGRYMSDSQFGTHLDIGRRFGPGKEFGIRLNGSIDGGSTPIDTQRSKLGTAALNLDYSGERVRLSVDVAHQSQELDPNGPYIQARNIAGSLSSFPRAPDSTLSLVPRGSKYETESTIGMVRGEFDILENVTAYAAIGAQNAEYNLDGFEKVRLLSGDGQYSIAREMQHYSRDILTAQGGVRATANTGPVDHALSLNLSRSELRYKLSEAEGPAFVIDSIYNPIFPIVPSIADPGDPRKSSQLTVSSIGLADTLSMFDERVQFMAGFRYQEVDIKNFNVRTGLQSSSYEANAVTPAFGLVVKPWENVSLYANYIEDLRSGSGVGTAYANVGTILPPYISKQYEAGIKVDWGPVRTTLAVFQIAKAGSVVKEDPAGGLPTLTQDGEERNRGIELNAYGELMPGVRLMGGLTLLDPRLTKTEGGLLDGKRNDTAPKVRAVVGAEWDLPFLEGLTLTGRVNYTGDAVVSTASGVTIPAWTTADFGARYTFDSAWSEKPVTIRFNVDNVFDKNYWAGTYASGFVYRGQPRTFRLSATVNF